MYITAMDKKLWRSLWIVLLLFSYPIQTEAQQNAEINISVNAEVIRSLEMNTIRDINFSPVQPSQQQINIDPQTDSNTGKMVAIGDPNAPIRVSFVPERILTNDNGSTLVFTYSIAGNDRDDQSSAEILQADNRNLSLNNDGIYYFWIGGNVAVENADPGNYNGDFTIEVEYI